MNEWKYVWFDPFSVSVMLCKRVKICVASLIYVTSLFSSVSEEILAHTDSAGAIQTNHLDAKWFYDQGKSSFLKSDFNIAISNLNVAVQMDPMDALFYEARGDCYYAVGDLQRSIDDLTRSIQIHPRDTAYLNRGIEYYVMQDYNKAKPDFDAAIEMNPTNGTAYKMRASIHGHFEEYDQEIKDWNRGIKLSPPDSAALAFRGRAYSNVGRYDSALDDFHKAIHINSSNDMAYNGIAWLLATCPQKNIRDGRKAVKAATKACEMTNWKRPSWIDTLAAAYAEEGEFKTAMKYERMAIDSVDTSDVERDDMRRHLMFYDLRFPYREDRRQN